MKKAFLRRRYMSCIGARQLLNELEMTSMISIRKTLCHSQTFPACSTMSPPCASRSSSSSSARTVIYPHLISVRISIPRLTVRALGYRRTQAARAMHTSVCSIWFGLRARTLRLRAGLGWWRSGEAIDTRVY